ncbi:hypothetical protein [Priestia koreensis]|uniref:hypothetical protein n=1 Tax=Priestia koreensis TaxID=284581 RepID=UPI00333F4617
MFLLFVSFIRSFVCFLCAVVPSFPYLTDRIGNYEELVPYFNLWWNVNIEKGFLEIISIEHDGLGDDAPIIEKGKDGNIKNQLL